LLGVGSELLPDAPIRFGPPQLFLKGQRLSCRASLRFADGSRFDLKTLKFGAKFGRFILRWMRRKKRPRLEFTIAEGAMKPDAQLPTELQRRQRTPVVIT